MDLIALDLNMKLNILAVLIVAIGAIFVYGLARAGKSRESHESNYYPLEGTNDEDD